MNHSHSLLPVALAKAMLHRIVLPALLLITVFAGRLQAEHIVVAVKPVPPFVMEENGHFSGYSIDLWNEVARTAGWTDFEFKDVGTVPAMVNALTSKQADVAVAALSITAERDKIIDFSHPFYDSGLDLLVKGGGSPNPLTLIKRLFTPAVLLVLLTVCIGVIVVSHILWFVERHHNHEDFPKNYSDGMIESIWWSTSVLLGGYCMNKDPRGLTGRFIGTLWALVGIATIAYMTATATTVMTVDTLSSDINGPSDLHGAPVATLQGTSADHFLQGMHLNVVECATLDDAVAALEKDKVKAVIYDSPIMMYYLAEHPSNELHLVGHLFDKQKYGFGLQLNSKLRQELNSALLTVSETDFIDQLDKRYFTPTEQ